MHWAAAAWLWVARLERPVDPAAALEAANRAAELVPHRAEPWVERALVHVCRGDAERARRRPWPRTGTRSGRCPTCSTTPARHQTPPRRRPWRTTSARRPSTGSCSSCSWRSASVPTESTAPAAAAPPAPPGVGPRRAVADRRRGLRCARRDVPRRVGGGGSPAQRRRPRRRCAGGPRRWPRRAGCCVAGRSPARHADRCLPGRRRDQGVDGEGPGRRRERPSTTGSRWCGDWPQRARWRRAAWACGGRRARRCGCCWPWGSPLAAVRGHGSGRRPTRPPRCQMGWRRHGVAHGSGGHRAVARGRLAGPAGRRRSAGGSRLPPRPPPGRPAAPPAPFAGVTDRRPGHAPEHEPLDEWRIRVQVLGDAIERAEALTLDWPRLGTGGAGLPRRIGDLVALGSAAQLAGGTVGSRARGAGR